MANLNVSIVASLGVLWLVAVATNIVARDLVSKVTLDCTEGVELAVTLWTHVPNLRLLCNCARLGESGHD